MRILIVSQVYWPDTASTAQHLADLGRELAATGHEVHVLCSKRLYEDPGRSLPAEEVHDGVRIHRLRQTWFSKRTVPGRLCNFASFNASLLGRLLCLRSRHFDLVLGMTSPPLVSFLGALVAAWKRWRFCYWAMDLQPELAIQAGMLKANSLVARLLTAMGDYIFRHSGRVIALDGYMADHIRKRGARDGAVEVLPVWPVAEAPWSGGRLENPFRKTHGFGEKLVIMYSGNHAVVHSLDTLLQAALALRDSGGFLFVFVGGGIRVADVTDFKTRHQLENIRQLPLQPRSEIHVSLASADLHVVVMGDGQVGYTHPNKVYGSMFAGRPFAYIGPAPSHVTEIIGACPANLQVRHGDAAGLALALEEFRDRGEAEWEAAGEQNLAFVRRHLNPGELVRKMAELVTTTP